MDDVIVFVGARGGQGTSTVAATAALHAARQTTAASLLCADPLATAALLGAPPVLPGEQVEIDPGLTLAGLDGPRGRVTVIDAGPVAHALALPADARTVAVVRGPCYLALHTLVAQPGLRLDGVIVVAEPGRSLSELDVAEIVGAPVLASVPVRPGIARMVDAGMLLTDAPRRPDLRPVRDLVDQLVPHLARAHQVERWAVEMTRRSSPRADVSPPALGVEVSW